MKNLIQFIVIFLTSTTHLCKFIVAIDTPKSSATSTSTSKNPTTTSTTTTTSTSFAPNVSSQEGTGTTKHADHFASFAHNVGDAVHHFTEDVEGMKKNKKNKK